MLLCQSPDKAWDQASVSGSSAPLSRYARHVGSFTCQLDCRADPADRRVLGEGPVSMIADLGGACGIHICTQLG